MHMHRTALFSRALITAAVAVPLVAVPTVAMAATVPASAGSSTTPAATTPAPSTRTAPDELTVVGGTHSLTGTFGIATSSTGDATDYQVSLDGGVTWTTTPTTVVAATGAASTRRTFTVSGLTDGVRLVVRVRGLFGTGSDAASGPDSGFASALIGTPATTPVVTRVAGTNRIGTAVAASQQLFPGTSRTRVAVIATSSDFADALTGSRLASALAGPLLLTDGDSLPTAVAAELRRVVQDGGSVEIVGGREAVSDSVLASIQKISTSWTVSRVAGVNRFATAAAVALEVQAVSGSQLPIYLASGTDFPDGLTAAPAATRDGGVLLLTAGSTLPAVTAAYLQANDPKSLDTIPVGGPAAAADPAAAANAIVGTNRYDTARLVAAHIVAAAQTTGAPVDTVGLATGTDWPDALTGAAAMGVTGGPLLLTTPDALDVHAALAVDDIEKATTLRRGLAFGGTAALSDATVTQFTARVAD